jgi:hypothetical protein
MAHMTQMLQYMPEGSPAQLVLIKSMYEMSSSPKKNEMVAAVDQMMKPDPVQQQIQQLMQQLAIAEQQAKVNKLNAEAAKAMADAGVAGADAMLKQVQAQIEWQNKDLERLNSMIEAQFAAVAVKQTQQEDIDLKLKAQKLRIDAYKARKTPSK